MSKTVDISKVFDKIWHDVLVYLLKSHSVENKLLNLLQNYLVRHQ